MREHEPPVKNYQTPNEFGAQKFVINHWLKPVAWVVLEHALVILTPYVLTRYYFCLVFSG